MIGRSRPRVELLLVGLVDVEASSGGRDVEPFVLKCDHEHVQKVAMHAAMTWNLRQNIKLNKNLENNSELKL